MRPEPSTRATRLALLYFAVATATLIWPIYPEWGNSIAPRVAGLPWSLVWVLIVIAANFVVLLVLYRLRLIDSRELVDVDHEDHGDHGDHEDRGDRMRTQQVDP